MTAWSDDFTSPTLSERWQLIAGDYAPPGLTDAAVLGPQISDNCMIGLTAYPIGDFAAVGAVDSGFSTAAVMQITGGGWVSLTVPGFSDTAPFTGTPSLRRQDGMWSVLADGQIVMGDNGPLSAPDEGGDLYLALETANSTIRQVSYTTLAETVAPSLSWGGAIQSLWWDGPVDAVYMGATLVYRSGPPVVRITATTYQGAFVQFREALAAYGLDAATVEYLPFLLDTSQATDLSWMFVDCLALKTVPPMDLSNVTSTEALFWSCNALESVPDLVTGNVVNTKNMFQNCVSLTDGNVRLIGKHPNVDTTGMLTNSALTREPWYSADGFPLVTITGTSGFQSRDQFRQACIDYGTTFDTVETLPFRLDTSNVTNMYGMFSGCSSLTSVPQMDTSNVTDMRLMFDLCSSLMSVPQMDTSKVTTMSAMFYDCSSLTSVPELDTSKVTDMSYMFYNCLSLPQVPALNTSQVTNMSNMFFGCWTLSGVPQMDTSKVTTMSYMFYSCSSLPWVPDLATSNVTDMRFMFSWCTALTDGNVRLIGKHPSVNTSNMLMSSGLTREPWFNTDGTVWRVAQSADYYYPLDYTTDALANHGTKTTRLGFDSGSFANRTKHAYVNKAKSRINVTEPWNGTFTMAGWFENTGSTSSTEYFFARGDTTIGTTLFFGARSTDKTQFMTRIDDGSNLSSWVYSPTGVIPSSGWFHVAVTFEIMSGRNYSRIYVNGTQVHVTHWSSTFSPLSFASSDWASAGDVSVTGSDRPWEGNIDDVAIWPRTLSASEVQAIYAEGRSN